MKFEVMNNKVLNISLRDLPDINFVVFSPQHKVQHHVKLEILQAIYVHRASVTKQ